MIYIDIESLSDEELINKYNSIKTCIEEQKAFMLKFNSFDEFNLMYYYSLEDRINKEIEKRKLKLA